MSSSTMMGPPPLRQSLLRKASSESSPPPSPNPELSSAEQKTAELSKQRSFTQNPDPATSNPQPLNASSGNVPSGFAGRQVTPPSPPSSLLIHEGEPMEIVPPRSKPTEDSGDQTPPSSLRDKFTRVFKGHRRGSSASSSNNPGFRRHQKETSVSTNTTNPLAQAATLSSRSSVQIQHDPGKTNNPAGTPQGAGAGSSTQQSGSRTRPVGGEVRIEIKPRSSVRPQPGTAVAHGVGEDGSSKYYDYYTRSRSNSAQSQGEATIVRGERERERMEWMRSSTQYLQTLPPQPELDRSRTVQSHHSSESQERKYAEEATSSFGFEGFHFGLSEEGDHEHSESVAGSVPGSRTGESATGSSLHRADSALSHGASAFYSSSGKASSSVLNAPGRSHSSLGGHTLSRSASGGGRSTGGRSTSATTSRPVPARNFSSSSFVRLPSNGSNGASDEVAKELKRLSKISAGSGMSGVAIVVAADGAGDEEDSGRKWTAEEKGKGKATSSYEQGHRHTRSDASEWGDGAEGRSGSEDNDDSKSLLRESRVLDSEKKLKSQEPGKEVIVHQGDERYDFVYRMRQTSDDNPILVPQYNYIPGSSFPNRNALTPPMAAKAPMTGNDGSSFASRFGSSPTRPPNAHLRSPILSYPAIPQGDGGFDGTSLKHSHSSDEVHASRRNSETSGSRKLRSAASMSSLEFFGGGFQMVTGSPHGTGARIVGSSLADTSEVGLAIDDSFPSPPSKKKVHYDTPLLGPEHRGEASRPRASPRQFLRSLPMRPGMNRRSITPHLWSPGEVGDINPAVYSLETGVASLPRAEKTQHRQKEAKIGRFLLVFCLLFPPLLFVMACGGFDSLVPGLSNGELKRIGGTEKRLALVMGTVIAIGAVVGVVVGLSVGLTASA